VILGYENSRNKKGKKDEAVAGTGHGDPQFVRLRGFHII
jgi:hypothetical protein